MSGIKIDSNPALLPNLGFPNDEKTVSVELKGFRTSPYLNELKRFMEMVTTVEASANHKVHLEALSKLIDQNDYKPNLDLLADQLLAETLL